MDFQYIVRFVMYLTLAARGGGGLPYKKGEDVRREISNEPLKGTNQKHRDKQIVSMNLIAINIKTYKKRCLNEMPFN